MNNILEMIKNEKVEWKKLGDVARCFAGGTPKTNIRSYYDGDIPWIRSGEINFNVIRSSERNITKEGLDKSSAKMIRPNSVVLAMTGATVGRSAVVEFATASNQSVAAIENNEELLNYKFLYYYISNNYENIKNMGQGALTSLNLGIIKNFQIPIPSLETQERIVKILDTMVDHFTQLQAELQAELQARNRQYEHYCDKLLSEEYLNKLTKKYGGKVGYNEIKSLCKRNRGIKITAKRMNDLNNPDGDVKIFAAGNTVANVLVEDVGKENIIDEPSVIVKSRGNIDFDYYDKKFSHKNEMWSYSTMDKDILNIKYVYYYLKNNVEYFKDQAVSGKLPQISTGVTDNYIIPVPNIEVQNEIVEFLDRFEMIIKDVDGLLPKEIELRQKQYEYYRERLLDFKREED